MKMEYITLNNGLKIPQIGLGMWDTYDEEAAQAVATALKLGYRHIDTAMFYKNEAAVGEGIRRSGVPRRDYGSNKNLVYRYGAGKGKRDL